MTFRRVVLLGLMIGLAAPATSTSRAQDDLLAPLTPAPAEKAQKGKSKSKSKLKAKPKGKSKVRAKNQRSRRHRAAPSDSLLLAPLAPTELLVKLEGDVKGAKLIIDGRSTFDLPAPGPIALPPGEHLLEVRRRGFADFSTHVRLAEAKTTSVSISLEPLSGVVSIFSDAPGAKVKLDGKPLGPAPVKDLLVPPGLHDLVVTREGFEVERSQLFVKAGKDYTVNVYMRPSVAASDVPARGVALAPNLAEPARELPLEPAPAVSAERSWYQNWYVWAGVGAVVAAGVAGAVVVNQQNGAGFSPEDVCGGPCSAVINGQGIRF